MTEVTPAPYPTEGSAVLPTTELVPPEPDPPRSSVSQTNLYLISAVLIAVVVWQKLHHRRTAGLATNATSNVSHVITQQCVPRWTKSAPLISDWEINHKPSKQCFLSLVYGGGTCAAKSRNKIRRWSLQGCGLPTHNYTGKFWDYIQGKQVVFLGDSLIKQMFLETYCRLHVFFPTLPSPRSERKHRHLYGPTSVNFIVKQNNQTTTMMMVRIPEWFPIPTWVGHEVTPGYGSKHKLWGQFVNHLNYGKRGDLVVLGLTQHHFSPAWKQHNYGNTHAYAGTSNMTEMGEFWRKFLSTILDEKWFKPGAEVFVLTPPAAHWEHLPEWTCRAKNWQEPISPLQRLDEDALMMATLVKITRDEVLSRQRMEKDRNSSVRWILVDIWEPTRPRWDGHGDVTNDCLHWCQPGMPSMWLQLLTAAMYNRTQFSRPYPDLVPFEV
eukprot:TRINITY_DN32684_c0_g1_i1.p1 TRINITY_DN32684_c0_g1~~TRINITY_DN32684_c0_g1_i1.p1  ORF type:complete len:438 (+),score=31.78 TRINITY_DN32684_c0_g1_i1:90-1403(+)